MKPNFSNHPMNWLSLLLVFVFSFAFSSSSNSAVVTHFWYFSKGVECPSASYGSEESLHSGVESCLNSYYDSAYSFSWNSGSTRVDYLYNNPGVAYRSGSDYSSFYSCSVGNNEAYYDTSNVCGTDPSPPCDYDSPPQEFYVKIPSSTEPSAMYGTKVVLGSCVYAPEQTETEFTYHVDSLTGDRYLKETYIPYVDYDESQHQNTTEQALTLDDLIAENGEAPQELDAENFETESELIVNDPVVTVIGDVTQTVEQQTEITTAGKGTKVEQTAESITVTEFEGIKKTETIITTTIEQPDGSKVIETERTTAYEALPNQSVTYAKNQSAVNWTSTNGGATQSSTTTTTDIYDAQGNKTGQTTTQTNSTGTGAQGNETQFDCAANPSDAQCVEEEQAELTGPDENGLYQSGDLTYSGVLTAFADSLEDAAFYQAVTGFFDITISQGSCPVWSTAVPSLGTITIDQQCSSTMVSIWPFIQAVLLLVGGFFAFRIAFLD